MCWCLQSSFIHVDKVFFHSFISIILMQHFLLSFLMNWQVGMKGKPHESWEKTVFDFFSSHVLNGSAFGKSVPSPFSLKISSGLNEFTLICNRHIVTIINAYGSPPSYTCIMIPCTKRPHVFFFYEIVHCHDFDFTLWMRHRASFIVAWAVFSRQLTYHSTLMWCGLQLVIFCPFSHFPSVVNSVNR